MEFEIAVNLATKAFRETIQDFGESLSYPNFFCHYSIQLNNRQTGQFV